MKKRTPYKARKIGARASGYSEIKADGGTIEKIYKTGTTEQLWNAWDVAQRSHFLIDHYDMFGNELESDVNKYAQKFSHSSYDDLPKPIKKELAIHHAMGFYGGGGSIEKVETSQEWKEYQLASDNINHFLRQNEFITIDGKTQFNTQIHEMPEYKILNKKFEESLKKVRSMKKFSGGSTYAGGGKIITGDKVYNPDVTSESPNYIGEVVKVYPIKQFSKQIKPSIFADVKFRDYGGSFNTNILKKSNPSDYKSSGGSTYGEGSKVNEGKVGGRGFFGLEKGEKIKSAHDIKTGDVLLSHSNQFNANNTIKVIGQRRYGNTIENDSIYWNPVTDKRIGDEEFSISDLEFTKNTSNEYYRPKSKGMKKPYRTPDKKKLLSKIEALRDKAKKTDNPGILQAINSHIDQMNAEVNKKSIPLSRKISKRN